MANYCFNKLTIRGDASKLNEFRDRVKNKEECLDFKATVPIPPELENTQAPSNLPKAAQLDLIMKYGHADWYDWQLANWGCKWGPYTDSTDVYQQEYKNGKGKLIYTYDTPWAPPTQWIINTSKLFPELKFENYCDEPGMCFKGTETIINGQLIKNTIK